MATFGIVPTDANTGYGYIKSSRDNSNGAHKVEEFVKKPDLKTAKFYIKQGNYLWNSGMFMFQARFLLTSLQDPHLISLHQLITLLVIPYKTYILFV